MSNLKFNEWDIYLVSAYKMLVLSNKKGNIVAVEKPDRHYLSKWSERNSISHGPNQITYHVSKMQWEHSITSVTFLLKMHNLDLIRGNIWQIQLKRNLQITVIFKAVKFMKIGKDWGSILEWRRLKRHNLR